MRYADVIIDHKSRYTDGFFTYICPFDDISEGQKVKVPFGRGDKLYDAFVFKLKDELPTDKLETEINLKEIASVEEDVSLSSEMLDTSLFMVKRYLCRPIEAVKCFAPAGSPLKSGKRRKPPESDAEGEASEIKSLTDEQSAAINEILPALRERRHELFLIHGVTGSGKTEVYMRLAEECIRNGRNVIVLVPEISLTGQLVDRFVGRFGADKIAVLHSKLGPGARYDEWQRIRRGDVQLVIGARSAVFAPFDNIGLIVLDEEHESSYKADMSPKYDTIEIAIKRAKAYGASVVSGSATPSVATYSRAEEGIYHKITIKERYNKVKLPLIETVDMRTELARGNRSVFSKKLYEGINETLGGGKQAILLLNRRGYSTFISCRECGYVMKCPECDISMVYHKEENAAVCHYCGRKEKLPSVCPECGSRHIKYFGQGTEKLEEECEKLFPEARLARLDLDTAKKKGETERILKSFRDEKTNLLVGTQLVAKGLDFKNVALVGILSIDTSLGIPDFRSAEKTFQLITQAAGRAGRGDERGRVVVQTYSPEHYAIRDAAAQNYEAFYKTEIRLRKMLGYPPFSDMIQITVTAADEDDALSGAARFEARLRELLNEEGKSIISGRPAPIGKMSGKYRYHVILKCPRGRRNAYMARIAAARQEILSDPANKCSIIVDVNPYSYL